MIIALQCSWAQLKEYVYSSGRLQLLLAVRCLQSLQAAPNLDACQKGSSDWLQSLWTGGGTEEQALQLKLFARSSGSWRLLAPVKHLANCLHLSSAETGTKKMRIKFITIVLQLPTRKKKNRKNWNKIKLKWKTSKENAALRSVEALSLRYFCFHNGTSIPRGVGGGVRCRLTKVFSQLATLFKNWPAAGALIYVAVAFFSICTKFWHTHVPSPVCVYVILH